MRPVRWRRVGGLVGATALVGLTTLGLTPRPALAQACTSGCQSGQIQFTPGEPITVYVVNHSHAIVDIEQVPISGPRTLNPNDAVELSFGWGTSPNIYLLLWPLRDQPIRVHLGRPGPRTLAVEIYSVPSEPSHRSILIENDGRVTVH